MPITAHFTPASMTSAQFREIHRRLDAAGFASPDGRLYHVCYGTGDRLRVMDVWESPEKFAAFGQTLMPILAEVGVDPGVPEISPVAELIDPQRPFLIA
jgi:hypothetical protein